MQLKQFKEGWMCMTQQNKKLNFALIMVVYLLGIFMGALDTGIVTPARTVIQNYLGVSEKSGIWMITMYTLAYAASIPIMGKLADKYGRKYIYLISIFLFGFGSLLCGLSQHFESFALLLGARAIQAIGGGGIVPVATAEFGTYLPEGETRYGFGTGRGVYGIAISSVPQQEVPYWTCSAMITGSTSSISMYRSPSLS
jgi:MFS family permease